QMREIIDRGHIFIAQPPLYKISKGKQEQYLKDDAALTEFLTQTALDGASLHVNSEAPGISGNALEALVLNYRRVMAMIDRMSRVYPTFALESMIMLPALAVESLADKTVVDHWCQQFEGSLGVDTRS